MISLEWLNINGTETTSEDVDSLQQALPSCFLQ